MRVRVLLLAVSFLAAACATARSTSAPLPPSVDVSGRWVGVWKGIGMMDTLRTEPLKAEFVQYGPAGRGHMVWSSTNTADVPESVSLPGASGVPVTIDIAGATVLIRHELGGRYFTAKLEVDGDEMVGHLVGGARPVEMRLTRDPRRFQTKIDQRVSQVEENLAREKQRIDDVTTQLSEVRSIAEKAQTTAEAASTAAQQASTSATEAMETANQAMARSGESASPVTVAVKEKPAAAAVTASNPHKLDPFHAVDVTFAFNKADLDDSAQTALLDVIEMLRDNPRHMANLEGYTDSIGTRDYNLRLSQRRVESVYRFLAEKGVALNQIHIVGLGPLPGEGDAKAQAKSRRVTVKLLSDD